MKETPADKRIPPDHASTTTWSRSEFRRAHILEIFSAALLSLATVSSAWCAYQSGRWNGVQMLTFLAEANDRTEAVRLSDEANLMASIDAGMFLEFAAAYGTGNQSLMDFIMARFRPEMKPAVEAWLATRPLINPDAPSSPFEMAEYTSAAQDAADRLMESAGEKFQAAEQANRNSDSYLLLTVIFSSVLFFSGINTKFSRLQVRAALVSMAILVFVISFTVMMTYPIY